MSLDEYMDDIAPPMRHATDPLIVHVQDGDLDFIKMDSAHQLDFLSQKSLTHMDSLQRQLSLP